VAMTLHKDDLPDGLTFPNGVAIDTETLGLRPHRDRLCLIQLSGGDGDVHLVQIGASAQPAPRLSALLADPAVPKIFHFARFDMAVLFHTYGVMPQPVFCTKIASKLVRTYTDRHGLKDLCRELLDIDLSKVQQSSDWGSAKLSQEQLSYAASDVLHLHKIMDRLQSMLQREARMSLATASFAYLPTRAKLDLQGWPEDDIFAH
jgi:ribonuclease D